MRSLSYAYRPRRALTAFALTVGLAAGACVPSLAPARTLASSVHASDGMLRMSDEGENDLKSIDPPAPNSSDAQSNVVQNLIFGNLVRQDQSLHIQPDAAASWTITNDGRTYTFTLRPGLTFADGTPVTASDVVYSLNRAFSPQYSSGLVDYSTVVICAGRRTLLPCKARTMCHERETLRCNCLLSRPPRWSARTPQRFGTCSGTGGSSPTLSIISRG